MSVFQIRNIVNEKVFVRTAMNLPGIFDLHKFRIQMGSHLHMIAANGLTAALAKTE